MQQEIQYDPRHQWTRDDYHGASLARWVEGLKPLYRLVCCNLAGTNAFFVHQRLLLAGSASYPPEQLYRPARFHLTTLRSGHAPSLSFLQEFAANGFGCLMVWWAKFARGCRGCVPLATVSLSDIDHGLCKISSPRRQQLCGSATPSRVHPAAEGHT